MSFDFTADESGWSRIVISNEPDYVVPLRIAPTNLDDFLMRGKWLCMSMSVWSSHDIQAGCRAIERVKQRHGAVNFGLRPFDFPEENYTWIPNSRADQSVQLTELLARERNGSLEVTINGRTNASPIWMGISDGALVGVQYGQFSDAEIDRFISKVIAFEGQHVRSARHS